MRRIARLGTVGAGAALLLGAMSSVSYAAGYVDPKSSCASSEQDAGGVDCRVQFYTDSNYNVYSALSWFDAYGEELGAWDQATDGRGSYSKATWTVSGTTHTAEVYATGGVGDLKTKDLSIPEGVRVTLKACQTDNGGLYNCHSRTATA
ncbi:hypothetical protein ACIBU0_19375 [Streptomyces sp. NPDC049627]|uniref:hypothetical protein n=1 Tax=Streptomyces sp. NPDC049627 TaxID=3365595 RepID=UPI0037AF897C